MSANRTSLSVILAGLVATSAAALVSPTADAGYNYAPMPVYQGSVTVSNFAVGPVTVTITGAVPRTIGPGQTVRVPVPMGDVRMRATYVQFGEERILQSSRLSVYPGRSSYVAIRAETTARVLVRNQFPQPASVLANGRVVATLNPGASSVLALPVGMTDLVLLSGSRTLASTRMNLAAMAEPTWTAQPPPTGDLYVLNPLPIPVEVVDEKGGVRQLAPGARTEFERVALGSFRVSARRLTGEVIDQELVQIRPGDGNLWRIDPPTTGLVDVVSVHWIPITVKVDGRAVASVAPNQEVRLAVGVGWHEVEVMDTMGHELMDRWMEVDPYRTQPLRTGVTPPPTTNVNVVAGWHGRPDDLDGEDEHCDHHHDEGNHGDGYRSDRLAVGVDEEEGDVIGVAQPDGTYVSVDSRRR